MRADAFENKSGSDAANAHISDMNAGKTATSPPVITTTKNAIIIQHAAVRPTLSLSAMKSTAGFKINDNITASANGQITAPNLSRNAPNILNTAIANPPIAHIDTQRIAIPATFCWNPFNI